MCRVPASVCPETLLGTRTNVENQSCYMAAEKASHQRLASGGNQVMTKQRKWSKRRAVKQKAKPVDAALNHAVYEHGLELEKQSQNI